MRLLAAFEPYYGHSRRRSRTAPKVEDFFIGLREGYLLAARLENLPHSYRDAERLFWVVGPRSVSYSADKRPPIVTKALVAFIR